MSLNVGPMDRQITIQQKVAGSPPVTVVGEANYTWGTFASGLWAARRVVRGDEYLAGYGKVAEITAVFKVRWLAGVTDQMRIVDGADTYDIQHMVPLGRSESLELYASAIQGASAA